MRDDRVYLEYVRESVDHVERYVQGGRESFFTDPLVRDAVLRRMETLADAASHLSTDVQGRHPEIPWRRIADFRNVLAHGYVDLQLDLVWQSVVDDLPPLRAVITAELNRLER